MTDPAPPQILTRIYITEDGDLIVSDLWDEIERWLRPVALLTPGDAP